MTISCAECLGSMARWATDRAIENGFFLTPGVIFFWARSDFFGFLSHIYMVGTFYVNTTPTSAPLVSFHVTPHPLNPTPPAPTRTRTRTRIHAYAHAHARTRTRS
jgi:hypothetical protein